MTDLLPERMRKKVRIETVNRLMAEPCWTWTGATNGKGYSCFAVNGKSQLAHRLSYEIHKGAIPVGLEIDHLCYNIRCINPDHLEAVTGAVNKSRKLSTSRMECLDGHKTYGYRRCRECRHGKTRKELQHLEALEAAEDARVAAKRAAEHAEWMANRPAPDLENQKSLGDIFEAFFGRSA